MERPLNSYLRLYTLRRTQLKRIAKNESLKYILRWLLIILLSFLFLFIVLLYIPLNELLHILGDANTILEPALFIILIIIFLFYLKKKNN